MNPEVASHFAESEQETPITPEYSVEALKRDAPEVFDPEYIAEIIKDGSPVREQQIKRLAAKHDSSLEKYLVRYETDNSNYYLTRNTNYQIKPAFENLSKVHDTLPNGSVPRPVAYAEKLDALMYEELPGNDFLEAIAEADEGQRMAYFQKAGELTRQLHNVDTAEIHRDSNSANGSIEMIMQTINADSFEQIENLDPAFYQEIKTQYDLLVAREADIRKSVELVCNHGDLHPGNLLATENDGVGMVDFTDVAIAPRARDIGGFLEQMSGMLEYNELADAQQVKEYQRAFLEGYGKSENLKEEDIAFYQIWQGWRNAMYFATKILPDIERARTSLQSVQERLAALNQK